MTNQTKKQREREQLAQMCESLAGGKNRESQQLRSINKRVDAKKRAQGRKK